MASNNLMEVTLPSQALCYGDSIPTKMTIKSLTVKEEKMMFGSTQANGPEKALQACIVEPKKLDMKDLLPQDQHFLLYKLRIHTFGNMYDVSTKCPECDKKIVVSVDLDKLDIKPLSDEYKEPFDLKIPNGDTLGIRLLRIRDNELIEEEAAKKARMYDDVDEGEAEYVLRMAKMIKSINGEEVMTPDALEYVEKMSSNDSAYLHYIIQNEFDFGYDSTVRCNCPKCGEEIEFGLPMTSEFFRPKFKRIK